MIVRALDSQGDWTYGKGENDYLSGSSAVGQMIQTRVLSFLGDCFFDTGAGIAWFSYLGAIGSETALNLAISTTILNTPDQAGNPVVTGLKQLSVVLNRQTRNLSVQYQVITAFSSVTGAFSYDLGGSS